MEVIGYLSIDKDKYFSWYSENGCRYMRGVWSGILYPIFAGSSDLREISHAYDTFLCDVKGFNTADDKHYAKSCKSWELVKGRYKENLSPILEYAELCNQRLSIVYLHDEFLLVRVGKQFIYFPTVADGLHIELLKEYDSISTDSSPVHGLGSDLIPAGYTLEDAKRKSQDLTDIEKQYNAQIEDIKSGKCDELKDLQTQLDNLQNQLQQKKDAMLEKMKLLQDELEEKKAKLKVQVEVLETQIYAIRCFTGEVVEFVKLRDGKRLDTEYPLVLHQKVRYLDEEMGRLCALYDFDLTCSKYFEEFIANNDEAFNLFCPTEKCISLVRISKDNVVYGQSANYINILRNYEVFHGTAIGILIRDGEVLYFGWADDQKISIPDNLFYTPKISEDVVDDKNTSNVKSSSKGEIISRYFLFNILQGCLTSESRWPIINLPDGINILEESNYIKYSSADGWIESNKYESFSKILDMCNESTKVGDTVIVALYLSGGSYEAYENERGRGYRNRTSGTHVSNNSVHKINLMDYDRSTVYYKSGFKYKAEERVYDRDEAEYVTKEVMKDLDFRFTFDNNSTIQECKDRFMQQCIDNDIEFDPSKIDWERLNRRFYISVLKDDSDYVIDEYGRYKDRERESRSNFLIDYDEFINIEVMNSNWLKYFVSSKKVEGACIGGKKVNYSYLIMYLNTALKIVEEREQHEMALLMEAGFREFDQIDWLDTLSRYKIRTGRHILKPRWAKQLAAELKERLNS